VKALGADTLALRVAKGKRLTPGRNFGRAGITFGDVPKVVLRDEVGDRVCLALLNERELIVEELTSLPTPPAAAPEPSIPPVGHEAPRRSSLSDEKPAKPAPAKAKRRRKASKRGA